MIVLDTNIIAALMQPVPNEKVIEWLDCQQHQHLYLPSIVIAEVRFGLQRMPSGQRQIAFFKQFSSLLHTLFEVECWFLLSRKQKSMPFYALQEKHKGDL